MGSGLPRTGERANFSASEAPRVHGHGLVRSAKASGSEVFQVAAANPAMAHVPWLVALFLVSQIIPWILTFGSVRLSVYRIFLLIAVLPCLGMWASGKAGRIRVADFALLAFCAWCALSLIQIHGVSASIQPAGMIVIETMGPYLLARCYVRSPETFYSVALLLFWTIAILLPFAIYESVTGSKPLLELFGLFFPTTEATGLEQRFGLWRVQGPFDHPILFGVCCGSALGLTYLALGEGKSPALRLLMTGIVGLTASLSLSGGAISALGAQVLLIGWNETLRRFEGRWTVLFFILGAMYLFIAVASNQSVASFYISRFSFDQQSAGFRLLIWEYGSASALNHPWFGVGFNEWDRPSWMPPSIDMFWLLYAVRHGIPAAALLMFGFLALYVPALLRRGLNERLSLYRLAYLVSLTSFFLAGWTVHFWNGAYVLFTFILGAGVWLLDAQSAEVRVASKTGLLPHASGARVAVSRFT
jgi:hypothetical protein